MTDIDFDEMLLTDEECWESNEGNYTRAALLTTQRNKALWALVDAFEDGIPYSSTWLRRDLEAAGIERPGAEGE